LWHWQAKGQKENAPPEQGIILELTKIYAVKTTSKYISTNIFSKGHKKTCQILAGF
jgi:hypothetical protein